MKQYEQSLARQTPQGRLSVFLKVNFPGKLAMDPHWCVRVGQGQYAWGLARSAPTGQTGSS